MGEAKEVTKMIVEFEGEEFSGFLREGELIELLGVGDDALTKRGL